MAGRVVVGRLRSVLQLFLAFYFCITACHMYSADMQCLSETRKPVDWYILYKLPAVNGQKNVIYYMDNNSPVWTKSRITMDKPGHAVYNTLQQIYRNGTKSSADDIMYAMYNDEPPNKPVSARGHTKGVVSFSQGSGFWLVHSLPKYPNPVKEGYGWPKNGDREGQTFLCISMATDKNMDNVGHQFYYNYPCFYDYHLPNTFQSQYMKEVLAEHPKHVTIGPWYRETALTTLKGTQFVSFAKFSKFGADLYGAWLAPRFKSDLMVESWQMGTHKSCSNCTGAYKVYNVAEVDFFGDLSFSETKDHAKWAVTNGTSKNWACVGDINRQPSQEHRAGGTVCLQNNKVAKSFFGLIKSYHDCKPYKDCVPPLFDESLVGISHLVHDLKVSIKQYSLHKKYDLYGAWLAPRFKSDLMVESWQMGTHKSCSNCTGAYKVYNVAEVDFFGDLSFSETKDHAKWAVTNGTSKNWACVGDINRQPSQEHRAGGTVCLQNNKVAKSFFGLIKSYHDCKPYKDCVPPLL